MEEGGKEEVKEERAWASVFPFEKQKKDPKLPVFYRLFPSNFNVLVTRMFRAPRSVNKEVPGLRLPVSPSQSHDGSTGHGCIRRRCFLHRLRTIAPEFRV